MTNIVSIGGREICMQGKFLRIAYLHGDEYRFLEDPDPIISELRSGNHGVDLFTFAQRLPETAPKFPYPVEWDNFAVLPVTTFEAWWSQQLGFKARNKAKQAEKKGVEIREIPFDERLVRGIGEVYNECPIRQGRRFPHYGKDFETIYREEATFLDSSVFIGAFFEGNLIGFIKLVPDETNTQAGLMNIVSMAKHLDKAPQNALIAHAVRACADRNISFLVYSKFDYGRKRGDGLRDFKERNGFHRVDFPRYYVPLTALGSVAFRLSLHRNMSERIPEVIAGKLRALRASWYQRRYRSAMGES